MSLEDEYKTLLSKTQLYLKQQRELYGEILFADRRPVSIETEQPAPLPPLHHSPEITSMKKPESVASEVDLFGNKILAPPSAKESLPAYPAEAWALAETIDGLNSMINTCKKCGLGNTRKKFVFGVGNPHADIVVVGEAPGADEDEKGEPFVGRAGQLLTKILEAVQFKREEVFICNILKCRPPNNRDPQAEEVESCEPYLWKQLELIQPKLILCAGRIAGQSLLKTNASLGQLREKMHDYRGIPLMVTYHPAALLRNPNWKRPCWEDVQKFRKLYDEMKANEKA
ncbi:MAG TPA: uracil-DNA glycosylase [Bacteroidota bacterium]|nr:uracil-DNA glycosylase [Bacteroidota bacterium]